MHIEWPTTWLGRQVRTRGILQDLVQLQNVCLEVSIFWQSARLGVTFHKRVRAHPFEKIHPAIPGRKHNIRIAFVYRTQDLIRNESFHLVHQSSSLSEHLLKRARVLGFHVQSISNGYHFWFLSTRCPARLRRCPRTFAKKI